jgi:DNA-binding GntR family transcriptional regulator
MATAPAVTRAVLADQIRDQLLQWILAGRYEPDARIVETQVARELGTSQAPVREALIALEAVGIVEISPFRGARVRRPSRREILEAYGVRSALETFAARLAVPRMTDAQVDELVGYGEQMDRAASNNDGHAVADWDARFHERIVELADNHTLERTWRGLQPYSRTYISLFAEGADPRWSAHLHTPIIDALRSRDSDAVAAALARHFAEAAENMAGRWPESTTDAETTTDIEEPS